MRSMKSGPGRWSRSDEIPSQVWDRRSWASSPSRSSSRLVSRSAMAMSDTVPPEHQFKGGRGGYTVGIEEELMILDGRTLELAPGIDRLKRPDDGDAVKAELHQSVLEIATEPA